MCRALRESEVLYKYNTEIWNETAIFSSIIRDLNVTTLGHWIDSDS